MAWFASDVHRDAFAETPSLDFEVLTSVDTSRGGADFVNDCMSADVPALIACEVAVRRCLSNARVASDEASSHLAIFVGQLVTGDKVVLTGSIAV